MTIPNPMGPKSAGPIVPADPYAQPSAVQSYSMPPMPSGGSMYAQPGAHLAQESASTRSPITGNPLRLLGLAAACLNWLGALLLSLLLLLPQAAPAIAIASVVLLGVMLAAALVAYWLLRGIAIAAVAMSVRTAFGRRALWLPLLVLVSLYILGIAASAGISAIFQQSWLNASGGAPWPLTFGVALLANPGALSIYIAIVLARSALGVRKHASFTPTPHHAPPAHQPPTQHYSQPQQQIPPRYEQPWQSQIGPR